MAQKKVKNKRRPSLLWNLADRLTALIYSFFIHGRAGEMLSSRNTLSSNSFIAKSFEQKNSRMGIWLTEYPAALIERSALAKFFSFLGNFWAALRLKVYGTFFAVYGLVAFFVNIIPAALNGFSSFDVMPMISAGAILLCSIPLLFSSQSAIEAISESRAMGRLILDILCVPKEHLRVKKQYGGTGFILAASVMGVVFGGLSIFTHPILVPVAVLGIIIVFAVFSFPEIGVVTTLALVPFMKYFANPELLLLAMVVLTGMAYALKVFQRKRTFKLSIETAMLLLFCGFVIVGGLFSYGGAETFIDSIMAVLLISGGFLLTYNLINTEKMLYACLRTITVSFLAICLIVIWESVYYGISARIIDNLSPDISSIADGKLLYIADNGIVFGMFAVFVLPLLFAYISNRKSVKGAMFFIGLCAILISAAWMCSNYEIIVALAIECIIFWFLLSHKTMTSVIFALIPVGIVVMLYPYGSTYFGLPDISKIIVGSMPASMSGSEQHVSVMQDVIKMICDGNFFGMGAGEHAFTAVFSAYACDASLGAQDPMSFWLQILCWSGVLGLISFLIFVAFMLKRCLGFFISSDKSELRNKALALFCGVIAALLLGNVYSIWSDGRVMYMFCAFVGLLMGHIRLGNSMEEIKRTTFMENSCASDTEIIFYD